MPQRPLMPSPNANRRLLSSIGHVPPAEAEAAYYAQANELAMVT